MSARDRGQRNPGWSLFPPALNLPNLPPGPPPSSTPRPSGDMNAHKVSDRRLPPIPNSDAQEPDFGAEVRDIPLYRPSHSSSRRQSIEKPPRIDTSRPAPQTHEFSALVSSDSTSPAPLQIPTQSRLVDSSSVFDSVLALGGKGHSDHSEKLPISDNAGELERPRTAGREFPERVESLMGRPDYAQRPGTSGRTDKSERQDPRVPPISTFSTRTLSPIPPPLELERGDKLDRRENRVPHSSQSNFSHDRISPEFPQRPENPEQGFRKGHKRTMPSSAKSPSIGSPRSLSRESDRDSYQTNATSLPALQQKHLDENDQLEPLNEDDLDPGSFDLLVAPEGPVKMYSLEARSEQLFSTEHLRVIFKDPTLLLRFTGFLSSHRSSSIPILIYYLDAIKALKAISYSNAIADSLEPLSGFDFTKDLAVKTLNSELEEKARQAFDVLVREELPAYITYTYIQTVSLSIQRRITGTLPPALREASEGLAEVFCLTDPSRPDNPIVFASEEFHRTTQYGMSYVLGRNCRFLQGPKTNPFSVRRIREKIDAGVEHCEVFLNYRRDGSPFMNLLMCAPLCDSRGTIRYFIGAQVDVSGLVKECSDMESLKRLVIESEDENKTNGQNGGAEPAASPKDEFQELSEMLNLQELDTVRRWGGRMHKEARDNTVETNPNNGGNWARPRLLISSGSPDGYDSKDFSSLNRGAGRLSGIYENYLLVRPYPSLRILFASPSLRVPGILQSPFMAKIGGSSRVREELTQALADGRGVTAKIRWVSKTDLEGRSRWIHCTPLLGNSGAIGVWMIVIVDDEAQQQAGRRYRMAPPVEPNFGRSGPTYRDNDSLRDFAIMNGARDREGSLMADQRSVKSHRESERSGSPYTLRID